MAFPKKHDPKKIRGVSGTPSKKKLDKKSGVSGANGTPKKHDQRKKWRKWHKWHSRKKHNQIFFY